LSIIGVDGTVALGAQDDRSWDCFGDISMLCCPFEGLGEEVIAIGKLQPRDETHGQPVPRLLDPRFCRIRQRHR
jgi:hypothetical protein